LHIADLGRALGRGVQDFKTEFGRDKGNREPPEEEQENKPYRKR
jgi:Sec-independent protein translocase protein TatA